MNLSGFNENQKKAVLHKDGACLVIAGAGSGKTRVLTYRIANLIEQGVSAENILAVTFTKKASDEMKSRLIDIIGMEGDIVNMGTFHSICYSILRAEIPSVAKSTLAKDWWQKKTLKEIMSPPSTKFPKGLNLDMQPKQALAFIGFQKNNLIEPDDTLMMSNYPDFMEKKLRQVYQRYEEAKRAENVIDFDDMLLMCYRLFNENPDVLKKYQDKFQYLLVDEYQDTNKAQAEIIGQLAREHQNVFAVGDDYQSIYAFRAGDIEIILNFQNDWPDAIMIPLGINYRSTSNIVEWSNKLISHNENQYEKECIAHRESKSDPVFLRNLDEDDEASEISLAIESLIQDGYQPQDMAILYRTNAQSRALEEALMRKKIPYVVLGSANFYERKEIKDILAYMRLSITTDSDDDFGRIVNVPNRFLGKAFMDALEGYSNRKGMSYFACLTLMPDGHHWKYQKGVQFLDHFISYLHENNAMSPAEMIRLIRTETGYDEWLINSDSSDSEDNERIENLNAMQSVASKYATVEDFLEYVDSMKANESKSKTEAEKVKLMSVHRSKGLEFPVVFVAGVNEGLLPHSSCQSSNEIEEERRLCYVAMTRGKDLLYMSHTLMYQNKEMGASRFLKELGVAEELKKSA